MLGDITIPSPEQIEQIKQIPGLLPKPRRARTVPLDNFLAALRYVCENNCRWSRLPKEFGNASTIYNRFLDWCEKGIFTKIQIYLANQNADLSFIAIDTTHAKCKRTACSFFVKDKERHIGATKGGSNTKIHALCDALGRPIGYLLSQGQMSDIKGGYALLGRLKELNGNCPFLGDKAYDAEPFREQLRALGYNPIILCRNNPNKNGVKRGPTEVRELPYWERQLYKKRHKVENMFGKLKDVEGIAFRKCRSAKTYAGLLALESTFLFWL